MRGLLSVRRSQKPLRCCAARRPPNVLLPLALAALAWCILAVPPVLAQTLPPTLDACSTQADDAKRLACYDHEIARLHQLQHGTNSATGAPSSTTAPQPAMPAASSAAVATTPTSPAAPSSQAPTSPTITAAIPPAGTYAPPDPKDPAAVDRFGLTPDMQHQRELEGRAPSQLAQITAKVISVHYKPRGELIVGLDNGQTWEQAEYDGDVAMNVGETVTIKSGALSAYYLKPHAGRIVRVRRLH
jgi:hypothetical protein